MAEEVTDVAVLAPLIKLAVLAGMLAAPLSSLVYAALLAVRSDD